MARVVVVGGGFAGLAVAARLARGRHDVLVLDRAAQLGGELLGVDVDGVRVPTGPATFTMPAVLRDLFHKTGKPIERVVELTPVDPARRYVFADGTSFDLPGGNRAATIAAFDATFGPGAGDEWEAMLVRGREMWEVLRRAVVERPVASRRELARAVASRRALATLQPGRSLAHLARTSLRDERTRTVLQSYAASTGVGRAPAALALLPYLEHAFGTWQVSGGAHHLAAALVERAVLRGAELRPLSTVVEITTEAGRASGVRLADGAHLPADFVVAAIDVRAAAALLNPSTRGWPAARAATGPSRLTAVLAGGDSHEGPVETFLFDRDPGPAGSPTTLRIGRHRAGGDTYLTLSASVPAQGRGHDWRAPPVVAAYARQLREIAVRRGLVDQTWTVVATQSPADLEDRTGAPGGAVLGPAGRGLWGAFGRAANQSALPNLYAVGASTHPGASLPFVGLSAVLVSDLIGTVPRAPARPPT